MQIKFPHFTLAAALLLAPIAARAHDSHASGESAPHAHASGGFTEELRRQISEKYRLKQPSAASSDTRALPGNGEVLQPTVLGNLVAPPSPPTGNGALMAASFAPFKPKVRFYFDPTTFFVESDNDPNGMPNKMVGITSWQQQVPLPAAYFASVTNPENNAASLGFGQPNYWRIPLVPTVAASPILIFTPGSTGNNFQRGAIALASNGIAIFNPANNTGRVSYEIGELDAYGGHCGLADDYHYHIIPTHLCSRFGGPLGDDKPVAWALDGYPIYGFVEPDGSSRQALDSHGGHDIGNGWGYHYHAIGTTGTDAAHPYGTPQSPYTMTTFHGTVVDFGGQVDGQAEVGSIRANGTGGYNARPVAGASIVAMINPAALTTDGSGHYIENTAPGAVASPDAYIMRVNMSGTNYDQCWTINRKVNPRSLTMTWRAQALISGQLSGPVLTTTQTYTPAAGTASGSRLTAYPMGAWSQAKLPDTGQVVNTTATFGEDSDYTTFPKANPQSFTDHGNGTVTDNVTGLMWQKVDNGESTWENAVLNAGSVTTGGYSDWRLPNPAELFSIFSHENSNPALNPTYFPNNPGGTASYWWTRDVFGTSTTNVWCVNAGGGIGGKPKAETLSAGGSFRYHARYVRNGQHGNGHNYTHNGDGTITDNDTSLMWTQMPSTPMNWDSALTWAENLALGGYTDWRMPNIKELQTLTDYTLATTSGGTATNVKPSINRTMFAKTLTSVSTTTGSSVVTCADTTDLRAGMVLVDPFSIAGTVISNTTAPTIASVVDATHFTMSANAASTGSTLTFRALPVATAYWSSTSLKGNPTEAWLLEFGVNNSVPAAEGPPRGSQGIISYQSKTAVSPFPTFAVRSARSGSITQGLAVTTTANLLPAGQRVSAVGSITATDGTVWTVPSSTQFTTATKAPDLYNEVTGVTPASIGAVNPASVPTVVIDADGEVITGYIFADNYFELYVNGTLVGVDPVPFTPFNSCIVKFKARRPITYAVKLVDWEEKLGIGCELNAGNPYHAGDGGFCASFSDGTVTNSQWKAQSFYIAPLNDPALVIEQANGTHDSSAPGLQTPNLNENSYALHYAVPPDWFAKSFNDAGWPAASSYTEAAVGVNNKPAYTNFPAQFSNSGAQFIWSSNLVLDNEVIVRFTGPAGAIAPAIAAVATDPAVPADNDTPFVRATVTPSNGATLSSVQLTYSTGAQTTGPVFREIFSNGSTANGLAGAINAWTTTATRNAADVKQRSGTGNRTSPILLTNCATTNGTTTVTCASTAGLMPKMLITGTNLSAGMTIASISNATTFVLSGNASGTGSGLVLTAAGATLNNCTTTVGSTTVTCGSTVGLSVGMGITGATTNPPNPVIASITDATRFVLNNSVTTVSSNATFTASGCGLEFANGTTSYANTMATTTDAINAGTATAGSVDFYVRTADLVTNNGWTFQISPDGGATWNTRLSENYEGSTVHLSSCTLNVANNQTTGSTTVTCASTTGLATGMAVQGPNLRLTGCFVASGSTTITCPVTTGLAIGMFVNGANIPNNSRITAIAANTSFTINTTPTASTTTGQTINVLANYLNANVTVSSITNGTTFVVSNAVFYSATGLAVDATTINHAFALRHYDLVPADLTANLRLRFQWSGTTAVGPARAPTCDIDDIVVTLTSGAPAVTVGMFDDGLHGDGAAGDGVYGVQLPAFPIGATVSYSITATDSAGASTTLASAGSFTTGPAPSISTNATLPNATTNASYAQTLTATGGTPGYVWSVAAGSTLPGGLALNSAGLLSGTASVGGSYSFTVKVTDSAGRVASKVFALTVSAVTAPNVVIILTDDQGWGDVGYHTAAGQVPVQTPNMDRIGTEGIRLEKFYATAVCATTRACMLTGRHSLRTNAGNQRGLGLTEHLMPQTFKAAGYQTFMCGKWHIGGTANNINAATLNGSTFTVMQEGTEYLPHNRGWDLHYGQYGGAIGYFTHNSVDPGLNNRLDWWLNGAPVIEATDLQGNGGYSTDLLADKAVAQIVNRDKAKPMLLYVGFNGVHAGVQAPASYINKYAALGVTDTKRRTLCAAVDCMDVAMGRVLNALDSEGIASNTLVIFMSDNGGEISAGSINAPLRGDKGDSYDAGIHTPAAIRWPGVLPSGVVSDQYVWVGDIFPTVCAATGVAPQNIKPFDGLNLWPALLSASNSTAVVRPSPLVTATSIPVAIQSYLDPVSGGSKVFKLIRNRVGTSTVNEFFSMTDDPSETTDLLLGANASSYTAIVTSLTTAITSIASENYPPYIGDSPKPEAARQGASVTLYVPFTSYRTPTVQWRKNGVNLGGATSFTSVLNSGGTNANGVYLATHVLSNVSANDIANYDVVISSVAGTTISAASAFTVTSPFSTRNDGLPDTWKTANGIDPNSPAAIDGPLGDIDLDGHSNFLEYSFGTDPRVHEVDAVQCTTASGYLQLQFPMRTAVVDLLYSVEVSEHLVTWSDAPSNYQVLSVVPDAGGVTSSVTVRLVPAMAGVPKKFVRVRVTAQ